MAKQGFKSTVGRRFATRLTEKVWLFFSLWGERKREKVDNGFGKNICVAYFPFSCATTKHIFKALKHFGFRRCFQFGQFTIFPV